VVRGVPFVALLFVVLVAPAPDGAAAAAGPVDYRAPVPGEVAVGFDAPDGPYGNGHRGVDLRASPGAAVVAAAAGRVAFAGLVAGGRWVTLVHGDGIRTSYGELGSIAVRPGDDLGAGEVVGTVGGAHGRAGIVHWSARRDGIYGDPLALLEGPWRPALVGPGGWVAGDVPAIPRYGAWDGEHRWGIVPGSPVAAGPGYVHAPNPNHVVAIAGLGSRTGEPPLDVTHLGYHPEDVTVFSYAGRRPGEDPRDPVRDQRPYGPEHTWRGVEEAALRLRDQLRAQWARAPGQAVDLVGHSMGGVVALYYLVVLHDPADPSLPPIGHVATIASPLEGADLAGGIVAAAEDPVAAAVLAAVGGFVPEHDPLAPAVADLAPGSDVVAAVGAGWEAASQEPYAGPLATGTRVLTLGAQVDLVVAEHRSDLPGADHVVLPGTHDGVRATEAARIVVHEFLSDGPVPGEAGGVGHLLSHPLGWIERQAPGWLLPG
jgi:hypothetical protein